MKFIVLLVASVVVTTGSLGQDTATLHIGSQAPELHYSKWLKGTPISSYDNNRLYVIEFWATWCVPCRIAMPHLSELAKKYESKATFIGVDIWEMTGKKPYETSLPEVGKFVSDMGDKMTYNVIADNNDQYMSAHWMKAAGQTGIPATFLIREGRIIWIGHPDKLDSIIKKVEAGNYDMAAFKSGFDSKVALAEAASAKMKAVLMPINDLIIEKRLDDAFDRIDKELVDHPELATTLKEMKFGVLLNNRRESEAMAFAKDWAKDNSIAQYMIAKTIADKDSLSHDTYIYAAQIFEEKLQSPKALAPVLNHALASCYSKAGHKAKAVEAENKAVEGAKIALSQGKWPGAIMATTVTQYQETLDRYKRQSL